MARFFALGMALALAPIAATFPSDRLLFFVGIGAMGLLAEWLEASGPRPRVLAVLVVATHLVLAPAALPARACLPTWIAGWVDPCIAGPAGAEDADVVVVNGLDLCPAYAPLRAALGGREGPGGLRTLSPGASRLTLRRIDERTLRVAREGGWFTSTSERAFWDPDRPWRLGEERPFGPGRLRIVAVTADGRPAEVEITDDEPLERSARRWTAIDRDGALRTLALPAPGTSRVLEPVL